MTLSRNPTSGRFASAAPRGAADQTPPPIPAPGPAAGVAAQPLPFLDYYTGPSPCQQGADLTALSTPPGTAGPVAVNPTQPMQDFGQPMGQTIPRHLPEGVQGS